MASHVLPAAPIGATNCRPPMLRALITLARPRSLLFVGGLPMIGFGFAYWDHGCELPTRVALVPLSLLFFLWAVPHAGTMWLNAALDRDDAPALFGEVAIVPPGIERYAYGTLLGSVVVAALVRPALGVVVALCALLSIAYSHPRIAWKGHAVLGPLTNALGYGVLSPLGGILASGLPLTARASAVLVTATLWIGSAYFAAQVFQEREDRERGYRTLVALFGAAVTLRTTRIAFWTALFASALLVGLGWFPRALGLALPLFLWVDALLRAWAREPNGGSELWARRFFVRMAIVTSIGLVFVSVDYELARRGGLRGGLATRSGHDEPRLCERDRWAAWRLMPHGLPEAPIPGR